MAVNSRRKGKAGELEAAQALRDLFGWECGRSVQHSAAEGAADLRVSSTPGLWFEVKRVQSLNVPKTMARAVREAGRKTAVLMHRRNRDEWLLTIRLVDLPRLAHAYDCAEGIALAAKEVPEPPALHHQGGGHAAGAARGLPDGRGEGPNQDLPQHGPDDGGDAAGGVGPRPKRRVSSVRKGRSRSNLLGDTGPHHKGVAR